MTPALKLFDPQLERMFVAALIADPTWHDQVDACLPDLMDLQAQAAFAAFANVRARGGPVTSATVRAELVAMLEQRDPDRPVIEHDQAGDLSWFDRIVATPIARDAPVISWSTAIVDLAEHRREEIADADEQAAQERRRRKPPTGPRAVNAEPVRLAEAFRRYRYEIDGEPTLVRWARAWWRYDGTRFREHDDEALDRDLIGFLDIVVAPVTVQDKVAGPRTDLRRITSKKKTIGEMRTSLLHVMPGVDANSPHWTTAMPGDPDPAHLTCCSNGILDLHTRKLLPRTPRFFSTTAIGAPWDPAAEAPTWLGFLASLWGDDAETKLALQQMFGYFLTADTDQHKLFALIGLPRSGKGTIARVLRALLGVDAVVNPTLDSLEDTFGLQPLVGKTLAIIGDARLGGAAEQSKVVERLLSISGEDALLVNRKNASMVNVRLRTRVLLLSNELPRLYDTSGALASRFVLLMLRKSFMGIEDMGLEAKLLAELPGIFRWAVDGYEDLQERGRFVAPAASERALTELRELASPTTAFLDECCVIGSECEVERDSLYARYQDWCKANGVDKPGSKSWFGRNLNTLMPDLGCAQRSRPDGKRMRVYVGVRLS